MKHLCLVLLLLFSFSELVKPTTRWQVKIFVWQARPGNRASSPASHHVDDANAFSFLNLDIPSLQPRLALACQLIQTIRQIRCQRPWSNRGNADPPANNAVPWLTYFPIPS